jgi:hypothetical protein
LKCLIYLVETTTYTVSIALLRLFCLGAIGVWIQTIKLWIMGCLLYHCATAASHDATTLIYYKVFYTVGLSIEAFFKMKFLIYLVETKTYTVSIALLRLFCLGAIGVWIQTIKLRIMG